MTNWTVTQADFDALLAWLDHDRDRAALRYEQIRSRLIRIFVCRGCPVAEELADQTIDRVIRKVVDFAESYSGDPALYFYGVAKNIYREHQRAPGSADELPRNAAAPVQQVQSHQLDCLEKCMQELPPETRRLLLSYYAKKGQAKIDDRKRIAIELGIDMNVLRIRTHRVRARLENCVKRCIAEMQ
jgi:DNA-directed RNA polymerase specialized sigma24 family protein